MDIARRSHVTSYNLGWDQVEIKETAPELPNSSCNVTLQIPEESVMRVSKFVEGILVGGHILVMIFSLCGNTAALIIILKSRAPKLSTKYFLSCLAISDLLMTLTAPPTEIGKLMNKYSAWVFGAFLCILIPCVQLIAATMSAVCLMAIAVERNLLIVVTMHANSGKLSRVWDKWICPLISVSIIVIPVACGLPNLWSYKQFTFLPIPTPSMSSTPSPTTSPSTLSPSSTSTSVSSSPTESAHGTCNLRYHCFLTSFDEHNIIYYSITGGTYFFLLSCFLFCYISIYRFVKKHGNFRKKQQENLRSPSNRRFSTSTSSNIISPPPPTPQDTKLATAERHRKTLRLILGLILLHICCRFPNWLYLVITNVLVPEGDTQPMVTLRESLHLLSAINSALNPFLYVIWNHSLRKTGDDRRDEGASHFGCCQWINHHRRCNCHTRSYHCLQSICCCGRYKQRTLGDHEHTSSGVLPLWKTPNIYYVAESSNIHANHQNDVIPSVSTQRVFLSDRSQL